MASQYSRIEKLEKKVADQITSQQIIPTLYQCIKELIDNSIDAKASIVKIQLEEYGKVKFSVFDNGCGIAEVEKLGEEGITSKLSIKEKNDENYLTGIKTLGFRGQAVNSIAHLCKQMTIQTVYENKSFNNLADKFQQVKYSVTTKKIIERKKTFLKNTFTKIEVQGLFHSLPVRKYQLDSKPKQNMKKVYELVFEISLIYPEVTFILVNLVEGKEQILLNIQRHDNQKQKSGLGYCQQNLSMQLWKQRIQICFPGRLNDCLAFIKSKNVEGFILNTIDSGSSKKNLRFSKNFQFLFVNRRPVNAFKEIIKVFDSYYKKYNPYTKYAFFLNLRLQINSFDLNLSPDKRDIFLKKQVFDDILLQIQTSIQTAVIQKMINLGQYKETRIKMQSLKSAKKTQIQSPSNHHQELNIQDNSLKIRKQAFKASISQSMQDKVITTNYLANYRPFATQSSSKIIAQLNNKMSVASIQIDVVPNISSDRTQQKVPHRDELNSESSQKFESSSDNCKLNSQEKLQKIKYFENFRSSQAQVMKKEEGSEIKPFTNQKQSISLFDRQRTFFLDHSQKNTQKIFEKSNYQNSQFKFQNANQEVIDKQKNAFQNQEQIQPISSCQATERQQNPQKESNQTDQIKEINQQMKSFSNFNHVNDQNHLNLNKSYFQHFFIHGQFNKGFILSSLAQKSTFFIVDQHAAEQKTLFESFIDSTPDFYELCKQLEITPIQADQIQMASSKLKSSGFTFVIQNRNRLKLIKCPSYFKKNFGLEDFMEIAENNKNIKDIPSFYSSAASKACRSAVMIGDELSKPKMLSIVQKMSGLKSPWNCPHGRPSLISIGSFNEIFNKINSPKPKYRF